MGMEIGNEHPIVGVGAGNLRQEVKARYAAQYPEMEQIRMPHNQLISVYAGTGLVGLSVFLFAFFYPFFSRKVESRKSGSRENSKENQASAIPLDTSTSRPTTYDLQTSPPKIFDLQTSQDKAFNLFLAFHVIVFASFMVENTIENSIGVGFYAFFLLLGLQHSTSHQAV